MYLVEIRSTLHRKGPPKLVPLDEVYDHTGFRTIFAYDENVAELIREQGGTQGLRGVPVYARELFIDFDGHDPTEFREWLKASGLGYSEWDSGNRSVHYHISLRPVFGAWVPAAMKEWVKKYAPTADISFYHAAGIYRLPNTYHAKRPGRCKTLVKWQHGKELEIAEPAQKAPSFQLSERGGAEELFLLLTQRKGEGHRQPHAWRIATTAAESGCSFDEALEHLLWWGAKFCDPPHNADVLRKQCESAYRRAARREA